MKKTLLQRGFTLIELLVVIAIIAILTAIVTTNFTSSKAKSRDAKRISDIAQIQLALALYFDRCNDYPQSLSVDSKSVNCNGDPSSELTIQLSEYISGLPRDPLNTGFYVYTYKTNNTSVSVPATNYVLRAKLETASTALNDDIDGSGSSVFSITNGCDDTSSNYYYCVKPN